VGGEALFHHNATKGLTEMSGLFFFFISPKHKKYISFHIRRIITQKEGFMQKKITYYLTLPLKKGNNKPDAIDQNIWNKITLDIQEILTPTNLPEGVHLTCTQNQGSPLVSSNVIAFGPHDELQGGNFILKRTSQKVMIKVVTTSALYASVVAACLLVIKRHMDQVKVSNTLHYAGWKMGIKYYQYILGIPAPIVSERQTQKVTVTFSFLDNIPDEDCAEVMENIRAILKGNATNVHIALD
jgi:hypothetical protein